MQPSDVLTFIPCARVLLCVLYDRYQLSVLHSRTGVYGQHQGHLDLDALLLPADAAAAATVVQAG